MLSFLRRSGVLLAWLVLGLGSPVAAQAAPDTCQIRQASVALAGGHLAYQSVGSVRADQPSVLLLHGLFASKEHWDTMLCQLADSGWHVLAPDLPGYGASQGFAPASYRLQAQRDHLADWLRALGVAQVHLAGNSMGGTLAALLADKLAAQASSVTMIGAPLGVADWSADVRSVLARGDNPFIPLSIAAFEEELALLLTRPPSLLRNDSALQVAQYQSRPAHYQAVWNTVNGYRFALCQPQPAQPRPPTLVIWGSQDRIFGDVQPSRVARCLPGSELVRLDGQGHLPHLEDAAQVTRIFAAFLQRTQARAGITRKTETVH